MRILKEIQVDGRRVMVKELTVSDIRAWLKDIETVGDGGTELVDTLLFDDVALSDIVRMTDLAADDIVVLAPSELRIIIDACREVNADFFALRGRLAEIGRRAMSSSAPSVP
jgi:hypothetical protein